MKRYKLHYGLGDCLVAGAALQKLSLLTNEKVEYNVNEKLRFLFDGHPNINIVREGGTELKWVSQLESKPYHLHTMNRFASQLNINLEPQEVLDVYIKNNKIINSPKNKIICINQFSAEYTRRYIPDKYVNLIKEKIRKEYNIIEIGNGRLSDLEKVVPLLQECELFIGPVSFLYHLASSLRTKIVLFTSYMPYNKFSHFINTTGIESNRPCVPLCEAEETNSRNKEGCWDYCKAVEYKEEDILNSIKEYI